MTDTRQEPSARVNETPLAKLNDFSLMSGGPLFQLLRRMRLSGDALEMVRRRVLLAVLLTWPPLLVLSIVEGHAWGGGVALPFLHDVETHLRLLVAAPLLILAEILAHRVLPQVVRQFEANGLIRDEARPRFDAAIASALRLRNSVVAELAVGRARVRRRHAVRLARPGCARRAQLVRQLRGRSVAANPGRLVAGAREHAPAPVPAAALVLQGLHLVALPLAGGAHGIEPGTDSSRPHRRAPVPGSKRPRLPAGAPGPRDLALRDDRQPDLPGGRDPDSVQGGDRRHDALGAVHRARTARGLLPAAPGGPAPGDDRVRRTGPGLRARVQPQVASRPAPRRRAAARPRGLPVAGRPATTGSRSCGASGCCRSRRRTSPPWRRSSCCRSRRWC